MLTVIGLCASGFFFNAGNAFAQEEVSERDRQLLQYVANIEDLLTRAGQEYSAGNKDEALRLATLAYIDNYEHLEWELSSIDETLIEDVEWQMREELLGLIRSDAPADQVQSKIDGILNRMDEIVAIIPEFGVLALVTLSAGLVISTIFISRKASFLPFRY